MFKKIAALCMISMLFASVTPKRSEAVLGLVTADPALIAVGAIVTVIGLSTVGVTVVGNQCHHTNGGCKWVPGHWGPHHHWVKGHWNCHGAHTVCLPTVRYSGSGLALLGILLLDEQSGEAATKFETVSADQAKELGMTDAQMTAVNTELDTINVLNETIATEVSAAIATGTSAEDAEVLANGLWAEHKPELSNDAFDGLTKISANVAAQMAATN